MRKTGGSRQLLGEGHLDHETYKAKQESNLKSWYYTLCMDKVSYAAGCSWLVYSQDHCHVCTLTRGSGVCPQENFEKQMFYE